MDNQQFITVKDSEGIYRPMWFITPNDEIGKARAELYKKELDDDDNLVIVNIIETNK